MDEGADETANELLISAYFIGLAAVVSLFPGAPAPRVAALSLALFSGAHLLGAWAAWTLGPRWCRRVIVLPGAPPVRSGPYAWLDHPLYVATVIEWLALPGVLGRLEYGALAAGLLAFRLRRRASLEDRLLGR